MNLREFAGMLLGATTVDGKLRPPVDSTDEAPGPPRRVDGPSRPQLILTLKVISSRYPSMRMILIICWLLPIII